MESSRRITERKAGFEDFFDIKIIIVALIQYLPSNSVL